MVLFRIDPLRLTILKDWKEQNPFVFFVLFVVVASALKPT